MKKLSICALTAALALFQFQTAHAKAARAGSPTLERIGTWDFPAMYHPYYSDQGAMTYLGNSKKIGLALSFLGDGSSSTSSSSSMTPYRAVVRYLDGTEDEDFPETSQALLGTANSDTACAGSSSSSSSSSSSGFSVIPVSYLATTEFGSNRVRVRRYVPEQSTWKIVQSVYDSNLFQMPFSNWQEPFSISTSAQGPQVLVGWFNSLLNVVRTIFYDGTSWTQTDFPTTDPVKSLHTNVSIDGSSAIVGYLTQPSSTTLTANAVVNSGGNWLAQTPVATDVFDPEFFPRVRVGAGRTHHFLAFNSGGPETTMHSSPDGVNWSQLGDSLIGDMFNFALSGKGNSGHLMLASLIDGAQNLIGRYYKTSQSGTTLYDESQPPLNFNFIEKFLLKGLGLGFNSMGHLMTGLITDATNVFQTSFSGLASSFLQPCNNGVVSNSVPGIFSPTGIGLGTQNYAQNDLSNIFESFASALLVNDTTSAKALSSYVSSACIGSIKHHILLSEFTNREGESIQRVEVLKGLSPTDSLGRYTQFSTSISQKGGTFSP